jgi:hypothetical protein
MPSASFAESSRQRERFPPRKSEAFYQATLAEILQERLPLRSGRRNQRGVKRKMSSYPLRSRNGPSTSKINVIASIRISK